MNEMKAIQIKTEPFDFLSIQKLSVKRRINNHSILTIQGIIESDCEQDYIEQCIRTEYPVFEVSVSDEENEQVFFHGIITDFSIQKEGMVCSLLLTVYSETYRMDLKEHQRFYQMESQPIAGLLDEICNTYSFCSYIINRDQEYLLGQFSVQYLETDWQFIKRLAGRYHLPLIPADYLSGIHFYIGITERDSHEVSEDSYTTINDAQDYYKKSSQMDYYSMDAVSYRFSSREIYYLGDQVIFNGIKMHVYEIISNLTHGELNHIYNLKIKTGFRTAYEPNAAIIGASFDAEITDVEKDKVLVNILNDENANQSPSKLFPFATIYSSPDGTGWYCMPETGDMVRLYIPSANESEAYVISAIHRKSTDPDARSNPNVKSLKTKYGKEVYFTPNSIVMTNHKGETITIHDEEGILIESSKDITMTAEGDISIISTEQTLLMNAADKVDICQGGTQLTVDDDISFKGGKLRME